ncbi:hypothetical protein HNQ56_004400 [Anaerotaenia torta]|uniref:hypothetical protein n=1 Tax=Anaerotaenia torta TaxID=433293 RepID=UPI003D250AD2
MGGRGSSSGKSSTTGGVGGSAPASSGKRAGSSRSSAGVGGGGSTQKPYTPPKTPVKKMSDKQLRSELEKAAGHFYASGKSGISFGGRDPYQAAKTLANQKMSRAKMEKDYKSILKRI